MSRRALVLSILPGILPALLVPCVSAAATNSLERGAWAAEFQIQPSIFSYPSTGFGIAAKRHFSDRGAVRFGMMVGISTYDVEGVERLDRFFPYDSVFSTGGLEGITERRDVSGFIHLARYVGVGSTMAFVIEAGPTVRWTSEEYARTRVNPPPGGVYANADDRDTWLYGLELQGGFEWFFRRRLSLAARYGFSALRTESRATSQYDFYNPNDGYWDRRFLEERADGFSLQTSTTVISLVGYW